MLQNCVVKHDVKKGEITITISTKGKVFPSGGGKMLTLGQTGGLVQVEGTEWRVNAYAGKYPPRA